MKDLNLLSTEFLNIIDSTKNLSQKTLLAYSSDLKDFCNFMSVKTLDENILLNMYIIYLTNATWKTALSIENLLF